MSLVGVAALLGTLAGVVTAAPKPAPSVEAPFDLGQISGRGERLILVIGGMFPTKDDALNGAAAVSFGDMAGFYVDLTDNYEVIGVYGQAGPDIVPIACEAVPNTMGECDPGSVIESHQAVSLQYHALTPGKALVLDPDDPACDTIGRPPCVSKRLASLLTLSNGQLAKGNFLLVSAFRTLDGAEEFAELARDRGAIVSVIRATKSADTYIGLGQEANPDRVSGPLLDPLSDPDKYQQ
jgi:hypothetical protein